MRMLGFRVQYYRGIIDAGWLDADDITVIVGKNESGKTTLLKALWKFHPAEAQAYDLEREWPRARRRERDEAQAVTTIRFTFTEEERRVLEAADPAACWITGAEISRNYRGEYAYRFLPFETDFQPDVKRVIDAITDGLKQRPGEVVEEMKQGWATMLESARQRALEYNRAFLVREMAQIPRGTPTGVLPLQVTPVDGGAGVKPLARKVIETVHGWLPTFIYMDDYQIFSGTAQLDQVKARREAGRLTEEDRTFLKILEMAELDLDAEVRKGQQPDRERRMMDLNDAGQTLTEKIAHRWTQKRYEVQFQADGQHFVTFVRDIDTNIMVPLEDRSRGFQWFFSFDMNFMYETGGRFRNAVLLLDEPGLHLHASAQRDLVARFRE
jgi:energy-coupling factor transporter ATP-binding protein EcfA2